MDPSYNKVVFLENLLSSEFLKRMRVRVVQVNRQIEHSSFAQMILNTISSSIKRH